MQLRRGVAQNLKVSGKADEGAIDQVAVNVGEVHARRRRKLFKKAPDTPLGVVVKRKAVTSGRLEEAVKSAAARSLDYQETLKPRYQSHGQI